MYSAKILASRKGKHKHPMFIGNGPSVAGTASKEHICLLWGELGHWLELCPESLKIGQILHAKRRVNVGERAGLVFAFISKASLCS